MYALHLSYDTARPAHRRDAYRISIVQTDDAPHPLTQFGPVYNGIVHYHGVYLTHAEARQAANAYRNA